MTNIFHQSSFSELVAFFNAIDAERHRDALARAYQRFSSRSEEGVTVVTVTKDQLSGYGVTVEEWEEFIGYVPLENFLFSSALTS